MFVGFFIQGVAGLYMANLNINLTMFDVLWTTTLQGVGVGLIWVSLSMVTFSQLSADETAEGSAIFHLVRNVGSSIFISVSIATMLRTSKMSYSDMVQSVSPTNQAFAFQDSLYSIWSMDGAQTLAALSGEIGRQATMIGYLNSFYLFAFTAFAVCPLMLFVKLKR